LIFSPNNSSAFASWRSPIDPIDLDLMTLTDSPQAASELILESYKRRATK
jgi:hypothetical protein